MNDQAFYSGIDFFDNDGSNEKVKSESQLYSEQNSGESVCLNQTNNNNNNTTKGVIIHQSYTIMDSLSNNPILTTASMPIPSRNNLNQGRNACDLSDYIYDLDSQSPQPRNDMIQDNFVINATSGGTMFELQNSVASNSNSQSIWNEINSAVTKTEPTYMDDEDLNFDIFQVEKSDLIQGPTLAELNGDYTDLLNIDDLLLPDEMTENQSSSSLHPLQISPNMNSSNSNENSAIQNFLLTQCLPNQLLHQIPQTPHNSLQSNPGIVMGKDFHYDEQQEISVPFEIYNQHSNNKAITHTLVSNAAFSPSSQSSGSSLLVNSVTPPPPIIRQQQQHQQQQQQQSGNHISPSSSSSSNYLSATGSSIGKTYGQVQHNPKYTTLHELLMKKEYPDRQTVLGQSVPEEPSPIMMVGRQIISPGLRGMRSAHLNSSSRLSSSAPTHLGLESHIWARREPRPHLLSTGSLAEATSTSSLSTGILSPEAPDFSQDEGYSDDDNSDLGYEDCSTDNDSDDDVDKPRSTNNLNKSRGRYFWQYNVQAKGPKGQRLVIKTLQEDPHVLNEVTDPVFSANCSVRGIKVQSVKHSGKARRGDGNVLDPDPRKLNSIGKELDKLSRIINDIQPVSELPINVRTKTRKEKNKLASRACRLKKKANHEANKIKLYGLENEHKRLINGISQIKQILAAKIASPNTEKTGEELSSHLDKIVKNATKLKIAGNSTEYVNRVLERSKNGEPPGLTDF